eukprot:1298530-Prorocentrum_lima.AAC.1
MGSSGSPQRCGTCFQTFDNGEICNTNWLHQPALREHWFYAETLGKRSHGAWRKESQALQGQ